MLKQGLDVIFFGCAQDIIKQLALSAQYGFEQTAEAFPAIAPVCEGIQRYSSLPFFPSALL
jgi:hypothetical protein